MCIFEKWFPSHDFLLDEQPHMVHYPTRWEWRTRIPKHYWTFAYFVNGVGYLSCGEEHYEVESGKAYLIPAESSIEAHSSPGSSMGNFSLHIASTSFAEPEALADPSYRNVVIRNQPLMQELVHQCSFLASIDTPDQQDLSKQYARTILQQFVQDALGQYRTPLVEALMQVGYAIKSRPGENWTIETIAKSIGLSKPQTNLRFSRLHNKTPGQFVIDARIEKAKDMLRSSNLQVQEIADLLGYRDVYFFSRQFKLKVGMTPKVFRSAAHTMCN